MSGTTKEIEEFYSWVNCYRDANINIGPINEILITLYENVMKIKLSIDNRSEILTKN